METPVWAAIPMCCAICNHTWTLVTLASDESDECSQCGYVNVVDA